MDTSALTRTLWASVEVFDAEAAEACLLELFDTVALSGAVTTVVLPFLREVGDRWEAGSLSVAHEHFISELLRRVLLSRSVPGRAGEHAAPSGPVVLLACPPGERHDMVLLCVTLMLRERGLRTRFLGADTPLSAIVSAARMTGADAVVLGATRSTVLTAHSTAWKRLGTECTLYAAGRGADERTAAEIGAVLLPEDPGRAVVELVRALSGRGGR